MNNIVGLIHRKQLTDNPDLFVSYLKKEFNIDMYNKLSKSPDITYLTFADEFASIMDGYQDGSDYFENV